MSYEGRICPLCNGSGEGEEIRWQPDHHEGLGYLDAMSACEGCLVVGETSTGRVSDERFEELCKEHGLCLSCGTDELSLELLDKYGKCAECLDWEHEDYLYDRYRDDCLMRGEKP